MANLDTRSDEHPWWWNYALDVVHSGSRVICDPPVTTTDDDYLLLVDPQSYGPFVKRLKEEGFSQGGSGSPNRFGRTIYVGINTLPRKELEPKSDCPLEEFPNLDVPSEREKSKIFQSWKKGDLNLVLTCSKDYSQNFALSTLLAKKLNLTHKPDRIVLFDAICYDSWPYTYGVIEKIG